MKYLTALLLLASSPAWGAYAYVQSKACGDSVTTLTCTYDSPITTTNLLVVACMTNSLTACLDVTDDGGDTFNIVGTTTTTSAPSGGTMIWGIWWATATASNLTVVTCQDRCSGGTTWTESSLHEYSGNRYLTTPYDVSNSTSSSVLITTTTAIGTAITPGKNGSLIFALAPGLPSPATAGNGNLRTNSVWSTYWATEDFFQDSATVYQSSFTFASGGYVHKMSQAVFMPPTTAPRGIETSQ